MQDMINTIIQYEKTHRQIKRKIQSLNAEISDLKKAHKGRYQLEWEFTYLSHRRETLIDMLMDMEYAISQMKDYQAKMLERQAS